VDLHIRGCGLGYKYFLLKKLLSIFDVEGGFVEDAARRRARQPPGCKGVNYGGKSTVLDAMLLVNQAWSNDEKYGRVEGIRRCWRKAGILPVEWDLEIDNDLGSATVSDDRKKLSKEDCDELCNMMKTLSTKARDTSLDTNKEGYGLQESLWSRAT